MISATPTRRRFRKRSSAVSCGSAPRERTRSRSGVTPVTLVENDALASVDARPAHRIPPRNQRPVLGDSGAIEPKERGALDVVQIPAATDVLAGDAVENREARLQLVTGE